MKYAKKVFEKSKIKRNAHYPENIFTQNHREYIQQILNRFRLEIKFNLNF